MHAVIKIVTFLVFGAALSFGGDRALALGLLLLVMLYLLGPRDGLHSAGRLLARMRWFFLSIALVYLFFTPGRLLLSAWPWGPTLEGAHEGLLRIGVLVLIVLGVNLLLRTTERAALLGGILWCLYPLSWFGLPHERLAVRIALTLDAVGEVQGVYRHGARGGEGQAARQPIAARIARIGDVARRLFVATVEAAEAVPVQDIELPAESRPPLLQWLYPLVLGALFYLVNW
jgi:energy-coupling factor transporter transmembrane protein EcfT